MRISVDKERRILHSSECERIFNIIKANSAKIGMRVNNAKTQLLCLSVNSALEISSYIKIAEMTVESRPSLKILGFVIGGDLSMMEHFKSLAKKYYSRLADTPP